MTELTGGLIQMNSHMITTKGAEALMIIGSIAMFFAAIAVVGYMMEEKWKIVFASATILLIGFAILLYGINMPKVKEIRACADGQVSIEQIGVRYDIVKIDGKELVLHER